ncbi:MAG: hypothetical protein MJ237_00425 [bacterium]|nr:hypothetical protein [bacterium]
MQVQKIDLSGRNNVTFGVAITVGTKKRILHDAHKKGIGEDKVQEVLNALAKIGSEHTIISSGKVKHEDVMYMVHGKLETKYAINQTRMVIKNNEAQTRISKNLSTGTATDLFSYFYDMFVKYPKCGATLINETEAELYSRSKAINQN